MKNKTMKFSAVLVATSIFFGTVAFGETYNGKAQFGKIMNTDYVVTQEVDAVFMDFLRSYNKIEWGYETTAAMSKGVAIGVPAITNAPEGGFTYQIAGTGTNYYWRSDYLGNVKAARESVAIGDSAQARYPVAVAIGDQAIVGALHTDSSNYFPVVLNKMVVAKDTTPYTTNTYVNAITNWYDFGQYERLPERDSGWTKIESGETVDVYEQKSSGALRDISYLTPEEYAYYNKGVQGGQGTVPLNQAYYGVAIGSRAYVFGYHGVALGHYAHVSRPWGMAIGSEAHVYSQGAQGFGYDVDIATNAPYSLAVGAYGTVTPGMTNAIVIGVPQIQLKEGIMSVTKRPTAVKNNSINFAYNGNGIQDFFLDGISLSDRLANEVKVVGNTKDGTKPDDVDQAIRGIGNIPDDEDPLVFYSGDGGIYFFTKGYEEDSERYVGDISKIFINGKPLSEIIGDTVFKRKIQAAAQVAHDEISTNATSMVQVKAILNTFFNTIKQ